MAVVSLAAGLTGVSASADYSSQCSWRLFLVKDEPHVPNQVSTKTCSIPAYSGGYQSYCSNIAGSNDRAVKVSSNVGLSWTITQTGYSSVYTSTNGGTADFTFTASTSNTIDASGTIGYYL